MRNRSSNKGIWLCVILGIFIAIGIISDFSKQGRTHSYGDEIVKYLEPNQKLINVSWDSHDLWFLTRDMRPEEEAESYTFYESANFGFEGTVYIYEQKMSEEEYSEYLLQRRLAEDYYRLGNISYDTIDGTGVEIFIKYEDGRYTKICDYTVDAYGNLVVAE